MTKKISLILALVGIVSLQIPSNSQGRTIKVTGAGDVGTEFNSNVYKTDNNQTSEWVSYIAPVVTLSSLSEIDNIEISVSPTFTYNHRREENYFSTDVSASLEKNL